MPEIANLMLIVWDRLEYTQTTLENLLEVTSYPFSLSIYDNGSAKPTADYLDSWVRDNSSVVRKFIRYDSNTGLVTPTHDFWADMESSSASFWGKIDNDIIHPEGWLGRIVEVLQNNSSLGVSAVCHAPIDFGREISKNEHRLKGAPGHLYYPMRMVGGCGYVMRREAYELAGKRLKDRFKIFSWTEFQERITGAGWDTAFVYPLIPIKHLGEWGKQAIETSEYIEYDKSIWKMRHGNGKPYPFYKGKEEVK